MEEGGLTREAHRHREGPSGAGRPKLPPRAGQCELPAIDAKVPALAPPLQADQQFATIKAVATGEALLRAYLFFALKGPTAISTLVIPVQVSVIRMRHVFSGLEKLRRVSLPLKAFTNVH